MAKRPLTQKEIRERKGQGVKREKVTIVNTSKQIIPITIKHGKDQDFYLHSRTLWLHPGKSSAVWKDRLYDTQITRLRKKRMIGLFGDTEKLTNLEADGKLKRKPKPKVEENKVPEEATPAIQDHVVKKTKKKSAKKKLKSTEDSSEELSEPIESESKESTKSSEQSEENTNLADNQELEDA